MQAGHTRLRISRIMLGIAMLCVVLGVVAMHQLSHGDHVEVPATGQVSAMAAHAMSSDIATHDAQDARDGHDGQCGDCESPAETLLHLCLAVLAAVGLAATAVGRLRRAYRQSSPLPRGAPHRWRRDPAPPWLRPSLATLCVLRA